MSYSVPTSDNLQLSRSTISPRAREIGNAEPSEDKFTDALLERVATYVEVSFSENTRRAYAFDLAHFEAWGGCVPASDTMIASYLAEHAEKLSAATLVRRVATISKAHAAKGLPSPTNSEIVKATMRGIKRAHGIAQSEAKPLLRDDLFLVLERMFDDIKGTRDRALLLLGFAGGFRRSELVGLDFEDLEHVRQGLVVTLRRSKTDQLGLGRKIGIPFGRTRWCPVIALGDWLCKAAIEGGPLFRSVNRHGHVASERLSGEAVAIIIRERLSGAGIDPTGYSGHSLRAGFATSAAMAGASTWKIRQQTGHASDAMLNRYIRSGELFSDNASEKIL